MVKKGDLVLVSAYAITFILLGVWLLMYAMDKVGLVQAFLLWLATEGLSIVCFSLVRTRLAPRGNTTAMGFGGMLFVFGIVAYLILGETLSLVTGIALVFIIAGVALLLLYLSRNKLQIED